MKVLAVDDEGLIQMLYGAVLGGVGIEVEVAGSGTAAIALIDEDPDIGVVLLDLMMPDNSGFDVIRDLSTRARRPRIVVVSALSDAESRALCIEAGCDAYITKPFDVTTLLTELRKALKTAEQDRWRDRRQRRQEEK